MSTKKEVNGIILILSCQKHKDTRLKENKFKKYVLCELGSCACNR